MILHFYLHYVAQLGEQLFLHGDLEALRNCPMRQEKDGVWHAEALLEKVPGELSYTYAVHHRNGVVRREARVHTVCGLPSGETFYFHDRWLDPVCANVFFPQSPVALTHKAATLRVFCPWVPEGVQVALLGSVAELGAWEGAKALPLTPCSTHEWELTLPSAVWEAACAGCAEFKFVLRRKDTLAIEKWEGGGNRIWPKGAGTIGASGTGDASGASGTFVFVQVPPFVYPEPLPRFAGCAIPVFSLRSTHSWGVGDFGDLALMARWVALTGQRVLQILPVNDTTMYHNWIDSYPYGGISIMALHPLYINIRALEAAWPQVDLSRWARTREALNVLPEVDYDRVIALKEQVLRYFYEQIGPQVGATQAYQQFVEEHREWLQPYAAFCVLRERFHTARFQEWGPYATYTPSLPNELEGLEYYYFVQYLLDSQLREAHEAARSFGVLLKGDIPIGVTPQSVEAWTRPEWFNRELQAGAPPDDFAVEGQNWGFPTYRWEAMKADGYAWWKRRFTHLARYFDAYRIDHILGFFRIWSIPASQVQGLLGFFDPALPFTEEELRQAGLPFTPERMVEPYITDAVLEELFGPEAPYVKDHFLTPRPEGGYKLLDHVATQRDVARYFEALDPEDPHRGLKEKMWELIANVLFVAQPEAHTPAGASAPLLANKQRYHPRIRAQHTRSYRALDAASRAAYDALYDHFFFHRHNEFWYQQALEKLPALIGATPMLCCAEDLGMIPSCVPTLMAQWQILSLEVQRMPKDPHLSYGKPSQYPYLSVCTTGSHDTSTLRMWWEEDREAAARFYHGELGGEGPAPYYCEPQVCRAIIEQHLASPSMLCILPWQDWMAMDGALRYEHTNKERINEPAIVPHYWKYRMHLTLEELLNAHDFNRFLKEQIRENGR